MPRQGGLVILPEANEVITKRIQLGAQLEGLHEAITKVQSYSALVSKVGPVPEAPITVRGIPPDQFTQVAAHLHNQVAQIAQNEEAIQHLVDENTKLEKDAATKKNNLIIILVILAALVTCGILSIALVAKAEEVGIMFSGTNVLSLIRISGL